MLAVRIIIVIFSDAIIIYNRARALVFLEKIRSRFSNQITSFRDLAGRPMAAARAGGGEGESK